MTTESPESPGSPGSPESPKRQRPVMATDDEWAAIKSYASTANRSISRYIIEHSRPEEDQPDLAAVLDRIEWSVSLLLELERTRLVSNNELSTWEACVETIREAFNEERRPFE